MASVSRIPNAKAKASKDVGKIFGDPTGKKTEAELAHLLVGPPQTDVSLLVMAT